MANIIPIISTSYAQFLLDKINLAKHTICVVMYDWRWYSSDPAHPIQLINHALVRAGRRSVDVRVIISSQALADIFKKENIKAKVYEGRGLLHSKCVILDQSSFILGSHNMTGNAAMYNVETSLFSDDQNATNEYQKWFDELYNSI